MRSTLNGRPSFAATSVDSKRPGTSKADLFTPYLSNKLSIRKQEHLNRPKTAMSADQSLSNTRNMNNIMERTSPRAPSPSFSNEQSESPSSFYNTTDFSQTAPAGIQNLSNSSWESIFDQIASNSEQNLAHSFEKVLKTYFSAKAVLYYTDVISVQSLYNASRSIICPHGSGLVGYCHFRRKSMIIQKASAHVSYDPQYDRLACDNDSQIFLFPLFNSQMRIASIIEVVRPLAAPHFNSNDEKFVNYLQAKVQMYSNWIFNPHHDLIPIAEFIHIARVSHYIEFITDHLIRQFNCKAAEIWQLDHEHREIRIYSPLSGTPLHVQNADAGIVGYSLSSLSTVSVINSKMHASYSQRSDGANGESVLVIPYKDPHERIVYAVALRGKRLPHFFTDDDESQLNFLVPILIASLKASHMVEQSAINLELSHTTQKRLETLLEVAKTISGQLHMDALIPSIMSKACELVKADRCSLFMVSENREKLVTSFHGGLSNAIEIPINAGIVGYTATTGQILNIRDAYEDPRFNRATDLATGYRTQNLLCVPIYDEKGLIRGVTEMINKLSGPFTDDDEHSIQVFNVFCGISIENARLYRASINLSLQLRSVLEISQSIAHGDALQKLLEEILRNTRKVIGAERAFLFTQATGGGPMELYLSDEDIEAKIKRANIDKSSLHQKSKRLNLIHQMLKLGNEKFDDHHESSGHKAIIDQICSTKESINIPNKDTPEESMIAVPVIAGGDLVLGAILMQWKKDEPGFQNDDVKMLESFAVFIAISLEKSRMKQDAANGMIEMKLREMFSDQERMSMITPPKLTMDLTKYFKKTYVADTKYKETKLAFALFDALKLREKYQISNASLFCFLYDLSSRYSKSKTYSYNEVLFTAQIFVRFLIESSLLEHFEEDELISALLACLCSNVGSPHHIQQALKYLYNDGNEITSHHCSVSAELIGEYELMKMTSENAWEDLIWLIKEQALDQQAKVIKEIEPIMRTWTDSREGKRAALLLLIKASTFIRSTETPEESAEWIKKYTIDRFSKEMKPIDFSSKFCVPVFQLLSRVADPLASFGQNLRRNIRTWTQKKQNEEEIQREKQRKENIKKQLSIDSQAQTKPSTNTEAV